jgi:hypothetical protein
LVTYERHLRILLIEDDNDDIELIQDALSDSKVSYQLKVIKDGGEVGGYIEYRLQIFRMLSSWILICPKYTEGKFSKISNAQIILKRSLVDPYSILFPG